MDVTLELESTRKTNIYLIDYTSASPLARIGTGQLCKVYFDCPPSIMVMRDKVARGIIGPCQTCAGSGKVLSMRRAVVCPDCHGLGVEVNPAALDSYVEEHGLLPRLMQAHDQREE